MNWLIPLAMTAQLSGAALDTTTTIHGLSQGCTERNPWLSERPSTKQILFYKSVGITAVSAGMWFFHKKGHNKVAATLGFIAGGIWGGAGLHNGLTCGW